jgi:hypothetical protein
MNLPTCGRVILQPGYSIQNGAGAVRPGAMPRRGCPGHLSLAPAFRSRLDAFRSGDHGHEIEVAALGMGGVCPSTAYDRLCGRSADRCSARRGAVGLGLKAKVR